MKTDTEPRATCLPAAPEGALCFEGVTGSQWLFGGNAVHSRLEPQSHSGDSVRAFVVIQKSCRNLEIKSGERGLKP